MGDPRENDRRVRSQLADSIAHIVDRAGGQIGLEQAHADATITAIRMHRVHPGVVARYFDLVSALARQDLESSRSLWNGLAQMSCETPQFSITAFAESGLGDDYERFARLVFAEFSGTDPIEAPPLDVFETARRNLENALETIAGIDPAARREIESLFSHVYVAVASGKPGAARFGGATSFMVWGATFMNAAHYDTSEKAAEFLVHEVTHARLSGLNSTELLVRNPPKDSFRSPLRTDPRPMDGIFHATVVCGRLASFYSTLAKDARAVGAQSNHQEAAHRFRERFQDGWKVIAEHGDLSPVAWSILEGCRNRLSEAA